MIRRIRPSLLWFGALAALLLIALPVQADDIEPEPYVEEEEPEPEPEVEDYVEETPQTTAVREEPSIGAKIFDCLVLRPVGFAGTVAGGIFFVPAAALASPGGMANIEVAWDVFMASQVEYTFNRPLGSF